MSILITGSHGVLGTALKAELRRRGHNVFGCDLTHSDDPQEFRADVANNRELTAAFEASLPAMVIHLAGEFGRRNGNDFFERLWTTNCIGTHNVIQLCKRFGSALVFASSSEAYGNLADYHNLSEHLLTTHVPHFCNEYSLTKWAGEKQIEIARARERGGFWGVSLRFFNVYGPGEHYSPYRSVICQFIYRLLHRLPITVYKGSRDYIYISDWATTVANIADNDPRYKLSETAYNIGDAKSVSNYDLATMIAFKCGLPACEIPGSLVNFVDAEPGNVAHKVPNIDLARRDLGHAPVVDLSRGIELTLAWMRERYNIPLAVSQAV